MKVSMNLSKVGDCMVTDCLYNRDRACHAWAITVGDGEHPRCDTFERNPSHTRGTQTAGVGACKVENCEYNQDFECRAEKIHVDHCEDHADCMTFERRQ